MWPWEHLAVGYILFSLFARVTGRPVDSTSAVAVAVGTQFPDLVDKPLAWTFDILPSGTTLAHSLFVAVPVSILVLWGCRRRGRLLVGAAFVVGYLSHLPGDVFYGTFTEGMPPSYSALLWPLVAKQETSYGGFGGHFLHYLDDYLQFLSSTRSGIYLLLELLLLSGALGLWILDGYPGLEFVSRRGRHSG